MYQKRLNANCPMHWHKFKRSSLKMSSLPVALLADSFSDLLLVNGNSYNYICFNYYYQRYIITNDGHDLERGRDELKRRVLIMFT